MKKKATIVICDPHPDSASALTEILVSNDYALVHAHDGHDVLDKVKSLDYDLALIATDTYAMDGFQVCRLLKESERTRHIPVMLASGMSDKVTRNRAIQAGADEFITKPYNRVELLSRVVNLLRIKHLHDRLENLISEKETEKRKLEERTRELQLLSDIARIVISLKEQKIVLAEIIDKITAAFGVEVALLITREGSDWAIHTLSSHISEKHIGTLLPHGGSIFEYIERYEKPMIVNDAVRDERIPAAIYALTPNPLRAAICTPIYIRGQLMGVMMIINKKTQMGFEHGDLSLLMTVSGQIALAMENMQLFNKLSDFNRNLQDQIRQATHALVDLKNFNESILHNVSAGIITADFSGRILFVNRAAKSILGYSDNELLDHKMETIFGREEASRMLHPTVENESAPGNAEVQVRQKDGTRLFLGFTTTMRYDVDHNMVGYIISFKDISLVKSMHETIMRMDRLAASGALTSAIAHEIRNPLAGIKTIAQALQKELPPDDPRHEYVYRIIKQINRLNDLLKAFFTYAKPVRPEKKACALPELIQEIKALLKARAETDHIEIHEAYDEKLVPIEVDENQFSQVMLNLMMNAMDAIGQGGRIAILAQSVQRTPLNNYDLPVTMAEIRVSDTGKGIPQEQVRSIFDPFFTTKPGGIGLGLSIVYRIVQEHGGEIKVESVPGKGTTFIMHIPCAEKSKSILENRHTLTTTI
ncbi:ATP-binding protein [bacterium]|nr:ATP-binding protein [bacterium]NUN44109.1 response regulator [bacterium]